MRFTPEHFELALKIKALTPNWRPEPGSYALALGDAAKDRPTPFQPGVHLIEWPDRFVEEAGGGEAFARDFAWLPTWDDGREWLRAKGVPDAHVYGVIKEGVRFYGEEERALLYQEILRILELEQAANSDSASAGGAPRGARRN